MMDDRTRRLGQHTAQTTPAWAIQALGPVPADPAARQDWEHKAASIAAYREMYGYDHPDDPIGPEPSHQAPDQRAAWHQAFAALGPAGQPDVRAMPDGRLWLARDSYAAQTAWAPRTPGKSCGCPGSAPSTPPWALSGPTPKLTPPARPATMTAPPGTRTWPPATGPCATTTSSENRPRPGHGRPAGMGAGHRPIPAPGHRRRHRTAPPPPPPEDRAPALLPNQPPPATPDASNCIQAPDENLTEITWIRDLAAQRQAFRAEMDERPG